MDGRHRLRLFGVSALALFLELALIRWLGCEVRVFAYFKNLVLIACFVGFGLGFYCSNRRIRIDLSTGVLGLILLSVVVPNQLGWRWGPQSASQALSNFHGVILMGDFPAGEVVSVSVRWNYISESQSIIAMVLRVLVAAGPQR